MRKNFLRKVDMELQEQLKQEAIGLGLCQQWQDEWGEPNQDELCRKFIRGIDFCIKHNFPSVDFIKENFDNDTLVRNGIFIHNGRADNMQYVVAMGNAEIDVVAGSIPCDLTILGNAVVHLYVTDKRLCYVSLYDNARVKVEYKNPSGKLAMSYYGGTIDGKEFFDKINIKTK